MRRDCGQATLELLLSAGLAILLAVGATGILQASWERGRCAWLVFENTHRALQGKGPSLPLSVAIDEDSIRVIGARTCGSAVERAGFRKLEHLEEWP